MSTSRRIAFGSAAHWVSRVVTIVLGLVLMPVLLRNLPKEQVGIWLLLGQSWAVLGVLDLGFGVTLTRRIAIAKGKSGGSPDTPLTPASLAEIADLVAAGRRVYRFMSAAVFLVSWSLGFVYLRHLELQSISHVTVWAAWTILCACQALTVWASVWTCLLQGVGYIGWDALFATAINGLTLLGQIVAVVSGGGIIGLAVIATVGALGQRAILRSFAFRQRPELLNIAGTWNPAVLKGMPGLALRAWLSSLGTVLVFNTDGFFIASAEGAENIPAFRAAFLVVLNVHILASVFAQSSSVFISQLWQAEQQEEVRRLVQRNLRIGLCFMLCGGTAILFAGEALFNVWLGPHNYVGPATVAVFVALFVLEQQSYIISTSCRATELEPFAGWMMAGALIKLALALPMIKWFGLMGLAIATLAAQLLTAHWYVAMRGLARLGFPFSRYITSVTMPCIAVLAAACGLSYVALLVTSGKTDVARVIAASAGAGLALAGAFWWLALDGHHRKRLWARLRFS